MIAKVSHDVNSNLAKLFEGLPRWLDSKESTCNARDAGLIPGSERSPGEGTGKPHQYSCLEKPMHRGVWWATVHGVTKQLDMTAQDP